MKRWQYLSVRTVYLHDSRLLANKSRTHMVNSVLGAMLQVLSPLFTVHAVGRNDCNNLTGCGKSLWEHACVQGRAKKRSSAIGPRRKRTAPPIEPASLEMEPNIVLNPIARREHRQRLDSAKWRFFLPLIWMMLG